MRRVLAISSVVLAVACGASAGRPALQVGSGRVVGNASVRERLATMPTPPIPWSTRLYELTLEQASAMCPYSDANVGTEPIEANCPDGATVTVGGGSCDPGRAATAAQQVGSECPLTIGEYIACQVALRQRPCDGGLLGGNVPECEAFASCIAAALAAQQGAPSPR